MHKKMLFRVVAISMAIILGIGIFVNKNFIIGNAQECIDSENYVIDEFSNLSEDEKREYMNDEGNVIRDNSLDIIIDTSNEIKGAETNSEFIYNGPVTRISNSRDINIGKKGKLTANAYIDTSGTVQGNSIDWYYQVSAKYRNNYGYNEKIDTIKIEWVISAEMRKKSILTVNLESGTKKFSAGASAEYQTVNTDTFYFMNTKGQKEASYRTNFVIAPRKDYFVGSKALVATARVKVAGIKKVYAISAGV